MMKICKVAVLFGGNSSEREVSLNSGKAIYDALKSCGFDVSCFDTKYSNLFELQQLNIDKAFIALHGKGGEDGVLQGALEFLGIPYTGSSVKASVIGMDKYLCKLIWAGAGLLVPNYFLLNSNIDLDSNHLDKIGKSLGYPLFIKPTDEGSSIGVFKIKNLVEFKTHYNYLSKKYNLIIAEECLSGGEFTCCILKDKVLPITEIVPVVEFFDYAAKYTSNETQYYCPARLSDKEVHLLQHISLEAFKLIGCKDFARVDFLRSHKDGKFYLLEINTIPGMTSHSLFPKSANLAGLSYVDLCLEILLSDDKK